MRKGRPATLLINGLTLKFFKMGNKKRNSDEGGGENTGAWMVTFSDLIMLLLTFFVLLLTMSSLDQKALKELISHLKDSTGVLEFSGMGEISSLSNLIEKYNTSENKIVISHDKLTELCGLDRVTAKGIKDKVKKIDELIDIKDDERGVSFSFHENIFFKSGTTKIEKSNIPALESIAVAIADSNNHILIMGHADNTPVTGERFASNWELSTYRGLSILNYFLEDGRLEPERFAVGGYGISRPLNPKDTMENKSNNRRVEIIFQPLEES
jgi:chemotaxis protein MotB